MNRCPSHDNTEILNIFKGGNRDIILIPGGLTSYYQPLDVSIKSHLKMHYLKNIFLIVSKMVIKI